MAICNWIQIEWFKLYCEYTYEKKDKKQICQVTTQFFSNKYELTVDASDAGVGAVLLQERKDDIDLPNCYFCSTFCKDKKRYPQLKKNDLTYCYFETFWCTFHPIVVFTDHNTVIFIYKMQNKSNILTRWGLMLLRYNLIIKHIKRSDSCIANVLSIVG